MAPHTKMKPSSLIHIGTSGWHYQHWRGSFYPQALAQKHWLNYYAEHLATVEINNSFYRLPSVEMLKKWRNMVPKEFLFTVKASRYITHRKKLKNPRATLSKLLERVGVLEEKLAAILFQLPPLWSFNEERFKDFVAVLPKDYRYAFEFRDRSWFNESVYEILTAQKMAFCLYEIGGQLSPQTITTNFIYLRLHGSKGSYRGQYNCQTLSEWADAFSTWTSQGKEIYCYFNNDERGYAPQDALNLQKIIEGNS